jgi:hypothetical protein
MPGTLPCGLYEASQNRDWGDETHATLAGGMTERHGSIWVQKDSPPQPLVAKG